MATKVLELNFDQLSSVNFAHQEVLESAEAIKTRNADLEKAMILGNAYKGKVKLFFKTHLGEEMAIYGTVWAMGDQYVSLKGDKQIPVQSITKVEI